MGCAAPIPLAWGSSQTAALLEAIRDERLELYDDPLLAEDLFGAKIVERSYGHKVELSENENGHGDTRQVSALSTTARCACSGTPALVNFMPFYSRCP
jgi:hypothetical protein